MLKKLAALEIADFHAKVAAGKRPPRSLLRLASSEAPTVAQDDRVVSFVFSDGSVDRYGDTIDARGWQLDGYNANPVALFGHDSASVENVIGKARNVRVEGSRLVGDIEFAEATVNPNAEIVFQMIKGGYLSTVSVGFAPIEWAQTKDRKRPGGIDFKKQELLEISVVPIPANPNAVALARAAGIDVDRLKLVERAAAAADWKVGASRTLSVDEKTSWDGPAAGERMLDAADFNGDSPDSAKARKGFLAYDAANPDLKGSYKLPFADLVDGKLTAIKGGIDAAASRLPQTDIPKDVADEARKVLDGYEAKMKKPGKSFKIAKKGLFEVSWLAQLLGELGYLEDMVEWEAEYEGDGSAVPQMLTDAMNQLGAALVAMTVEEVTELLGDEANGEHAPILVDDPMMMGDSFTPAQRALVALARAAKPSALRFRAHPSEMGEIESRIFTADELATLKALAATTVKAGKTISVATETKLRDAHATITKGCDMLKGVFEPGDATNPADDQGKALQERRDAAKKLKDELAA